MAEIVGRPVYELEEDLPLHELLEWRAYLRLKAKEEKKAMDAAGRESKRGGKKR